MYCFKNSKIQLKKTIRICADFGEKAPISEAAETPVDGDTSQSAGNSSDEKDDGELTFSVYNHLCRLYRAFVCLIDIDFHLQ